MERERERERERANERERDQLWRNSTTRKIIAPMLDPGIVQQKFNFPAFSNPWQCGEIYKFRGLSLHPEKVA